MKKLVALLSVLIFTLGVSFPTFAIVKMVNTTKSCIVVANGKKVTDNATDNATENATKKEKKRRMEGC